MLKGERQILEGVVYTDGKMLPPRIHTDWNRF
jgi:hypothetical protein